MARKKSSPSVTYRSANQGCYHAGVFYAPGEVLPEMPLHCLNVHLSGGNVELVEEPTPEEVVEVINQVIEDERLATL